MSNIEAIITRIKADPVFKRRAYLEWSQGAFGEGVVTALYESDSEIALAALRGTMDAIYRRYAVEEETGIPADAWRDRST